MTEPDRCGPRRNDGPDAADRSAAAAAVHAVVLDHRGSWVHATCPVCGWTGPARRAASRAAEDGEVHRLLAQL